METPRTTPLSILTLAQHCPPKTVFFAQWFGSLLGIPINYAVVRWVLNTKRDYLTGELVDPTHQWTGQSLASNLTMAVQYVLLVSPHPLLLTK